MCQECRPGDSSQDFHSLKRALAYVSTGVYPDDFKGSELPSLNDRVQGHEAREQVLDGQEEKFPNTGSSSEGGGVSGLEVSITQAPRVQSLR